MHERMTSVYREIYIPTAKRVLTDHPEARHALEELFPELVKQEKTTVVTNAFFNGNRNHGGYSEEGTLTNDFLNEHQFTKITFEWKE